MTMNQIAKIDSAVPLDGRHPDAQTVTAVKQRLAEAGVEVRP